MQKKLIALAVAGLGFTGAAFAQTNVTIYGIFDATFDSVSASSATGVAAATATHPAYTGANRENFTRVNSNSSYIGFKGTEDLGDGLKAIFQFETGFNTDAGIYSGSARDTFVGLQGGWGTIKLGNLTGPTRAIGTTLDLLPGRTGIGTFDSLLGRGVTSTFGTATLFDNRFANTLSYTTPTISGFNAVLNYAPGENKNLSTATAAGQANGKTYELGLTYANGPWYAAYAYGKLDTGSTNAIAGNTPLTWKSNRVGLGYTFEAGHKINFIWDKQEQDIAKTATTMAELDKSGWSLQGLYKVTPTSSLLGAYTKSNQASGNFLLTNNDTGAKMWTLGYLYSLSKRTTVKAVYSKISNENNVAYDFATNGVAGGFGLGADPQGVSVGLRHSF